MIEEFLTENRIKGAVFDMDGTLTDSMKEWGKIYGILSELLGAPLPDDLTLALNCMPMQRRVRAVADKLSLGIDAARVYSLWVERARRYYGGVFKIKPYMLDTVRTLHKFGVAMAIASATDLACVNDFLRSNGLLRCFSVTVGLDEVERPKSFPDIYLKAAQRLQVLPRECIVFEDTLVTVKSAKSGGFWVCGVQDDCSASDEDEIKRTAHFTLGMN